VESALIVLAENSPQSAIVENSTQSAIGENFAQSVLGKNFTQSVLGKSSNLAVPRGDLTDPQDSVFTTCMLLIALKVLEARGQLDRVGGKAGKLESNQDVNLLLTRLHKQVSAVTPTDISKALDFDSKLVLSTPSSKISQALGHLAKTSALMWQDDFAIGYAYQFMSMARRKSAQAKIQTANKQLSQADLIAFTQLYTPQWVVDFLLANSALHQLKPDSKNSAPEVYTRWSITAAADLPTDGNIIAGNLSVGNLSAGDLSAGDLCASKPWAGNLDASELSILDPACGAGNFLVRALDLAINLHMEAGLSAEDSVDTAQKQNIFGADIDLNALWITCLSLLVKSFEYSTRPPSGKFNLSIASSGSFHNNDETIPTSGTSSEDELLGSLARKFPENHVLSRKFSVLLMNPPYIGRKLMSRQLKSALKRDYPNSHSDISAAFIERCLELLNHGGRLGTITQASVLTLPSYGNLRKKILTDFNLIACADAGSGVFPLQGGDKVNSALIVIEKTENRARSIFFDLRQHKNKPSELAAQIESIKNQEPGSYFIHDQYSFLEEHESAIKYGCPGIILELCRQVPSLSDVADIRQGLATTNNERFIKRIDDVPAELIGTTWMPYVKGAGSDRWYSPIVYVVNWGNDGQEIKEAVSAAYPYLNGNIKWVVKNEQFYFRSGLCFSFVNTGNLAVRKLPGGCIFDVGASAVFANNSQDEDFLLAYLNSSLIAAIAKCMNPTVNFQVGDIKRLPMFPFNQTEKTQLSEISHECQQLAMRVHELKLAASAAIEASSESSIETAQCQTSEQLSILEAKSDKIILTTLFRAFQLTLVQQNDITAWLERTVMKYAKSIRKRASVTS
jgi:N-6 DNA Methylase